VAQITLRNENKKNNEEEERKVMQSRQNESFPPFLVLFTPICSPSQTNLPLGVSKKIKKPIKPRKPEKN
jgi:hypothetical protein